MIRPFGRWRYTWFIGVATITAVGVLAALYFTTPAHHNQQQGITYTNTLPTSVPSSFVRLMKLQATSGLSAQGFALTDQRGEAISLTNLRGKVVVLTFLDPHCEDICPIISAEFLRAYHDLGSSKDKVVFVAVNVNPYHGQRSDVATFSHEQQLDTIPSWHFVTGPNMTLQAVWRAYGVTVQAPNPNVDVIHTSPLYFIDPQGTERYMATPTDKKTTTGQAYLSMGDLTSWGTGIALVARGMVSS